MRSFRTSEWDKYENLPVEYSRIYQFEDIKKTFRRVTKGKSEGAEVNLKIFFEIKFLILLKLIKY